MKAAVYYGVRDVRVEEVPDPVIGRGEVLVRVGAAGICGTDLRIYTRGHHRIPVGTSRILGHEFAGELVAVGEEVSSLAVGARVAVAPNIGCGACHQCVAGWTNLCAEHTALGISLDGGFAEYVRVPAEAVARGNVVPIPAGVPYTAAALAEPLSCCLGAQEMLGLGVGDVVLVVGAGPMGLMHLVLARLAGVRTAIVSGWPATRLQWARACGADIVVDPRHDDLKRRVLEVTDGRGADCVIVTAGAPEALEQALELVSRRGRIHIFAGLPHDQPFVRLDANLVHYRQLVVTGSTGSNLRQFRAAIDLIASGRLSVDLLISGMVPLDRFLDGVERALTKQELRILVEPNADLPTPRTSRDLASNTGGVSA